MWEFAENFELGATFDSSPYPPCTGTVSGNEKKKCDSSKTGVPYTVDEEKSLPFYVGVGGVGENGGGGKLAPPLEKRSGLP